MKIATIAILALVAAAPASASRPSLRAVLVADDLRLSEGQDREIVKEQNFSPIARAFKVDATRPDLVRSGKKIFSVGENEVTVTSRPDHTTVTREYESSTEASESASFYLGVDVAIFGFAASIDMSTSSMNSSKKKFIRIDDHRNTEVSRVSLDPVNMQEYLLPDVKQFLLTRSPADILETIGPFYATQLTLGATFTLSVLGEVQSEAQAKSFAMEVSANYLSFVKMSVGGSHDSSSASSCTDFTTTYATSGGDSTIWHSKTKPVDELQAEWHASITNENLSVIRPKLKYIWTLLAHDDMNHTKAAEVEEYITGKWEEEKAGVVEKEMELVPATWKKDKVVEGNVIIGQPDEQAGRYASRSYTNRACNMVIDSESTSDDGLWDLTQLLCEHNSQCLMWGSNSYVGHLSLPEGIKAETYWKHGEGTQFNTYEATKAETEDGAMEIGDFWNRDHNYRVWKFKFTVLPGYTCNNQDTATCQ